MKLILLLSTVLLLASAFACGHRQPVSLSLVNWTIGDCVKQKVLVGNTPKPYNPLHHADDEALDAYGNCAWLFRLYDQDRNAELSRDECLAMASEPMLGFNPSDC